MVFVLHEEICNTENQTSQPFPAIGREVFPSAAIPKGPH